MVASSAPELGARRHRRLLPHRQAAAWLCERLHRGRGFFSCWGGTVSGSCTSGVRCGCCYQRKGDLYIGPSLHRHGGPSLVWGLALGRCVAPSLDAHGTWTCPGKWGLSVGQGCSPSPEVSLVPGAGSRQGFPSMVLEFLSPGWVGASDPGTSLPHQHRDVTHPPFCL